MPLNDQILIFARYPVAGHSKTRLIPALGPAGAARLHRRMAEHMTVIARQTRQERSGSEGVDVVVCATGGRRRDFRAWLGADLRYVNQPSGDLGIRLRRGFCDAFRASAGRVLSVGTDVPSLCASLLRQAFDRLRECDVVLGPARDGGYYLVGMKRELPAIFENIDWGSDRVRAQTLAVAERLGLNVLELPTLGDVDRPEDLAPLRDDPRFADVFDVRPKISVIVPTLNEASVLDTTLSRVFHGENIEVIVSDGGSQDETLAIAKRAGATVVCAGGGRAAQQNAGAAAATGRLLLFLHADTQIPDGFAESIRRLLDVPSVVAGAFRFKTDGTGMTMRLIEWGTNIRAKFFQLAYGDQGLFMEKRIFDELGGFAPLPIMEDFDLVQRLRRRGRVVILPQAAVTSGRRWMRLGAIRTLLRNQLVILGFLIGVSPDQLSRFYRRPSRKS